MQALAQELATAKERAGLATDLPPAAAAQQLVRSLLTLRANFMQMCQG